MIKIERKRILQVISTTYTALIKNKVVVVTMFSRLTSIVFVTFKSVVVAVFYVHNSTIICFHCVKFDHKKSDCFDLNKLSTIRIHKIMNNSDQKMKKIFELVDEKKKI